MPKFDALHVETSAGLLLTLVFGVLQEANGGAEKEESAGSDEDSSSDEDLVSFAAMGLCLYGVIKPHGTIYSSISECNLQIVQLLGLY